MSQQAERLDSPTGWVREHARQYIESDGAEGHIWRGAPTLALTTTGRRTGQLHRTMLIDGGSGDRYIVVASRGGAATHPQWYLNLEAKPEVQVQVLAVDSRPVRARQHQRRGRRSGS